MIEVLPKSETGQGFTYCLNQEKYLRVFLEDGNVPADNNAAKGRIVTAFCIGKRNWHLIDTIDGAKASAIIYSIAETAKANNLKPYNYFELLLTEIPKHMEDTNLDFLDNLCHGPKTFQLNVKNRPANSISRQKWRL